MYTSVIMFVFFICKSYSINLRVTISVNKNSTTTYINELDEKNIRRTI